MKLFHNLYTLNELGIHNNLSNIELKQLNKYIKTNNIDAIKKNYKVLAKFIPYCKAYILPNEEQTLAISASLYDTYCVTGLLPDIENYDINPDIEKLEHWQYISPMNLEIQPREGWKFAEKYFKDKDSKIKESDIWNIFLSGCARIDYYQKKNVKIEERIKYAIMEYMLKRPQFFNTEDFFDNEILHKKYKK